MTKTKKNLLIASLILDVIILIPVLFYFLVIPRSEIESLQKSYVQTKIENKKASYKIVSKKPKGWKTLKEISYVAAHAIVVSEDWDFYNHSGYDLGQVKEAVEDTANGKKLRGASTISQQLVKNLFLSNERSFVRKAKELSFTMYMERSVSKEKILEIYLNIIEYGEGIYGIENAAKHYFKKSSKNLTAREGAFLAMLLPSPKKHAQSFKDKKLTPYANKVVNNVLKKMVKAKYLKKEQLNREQVRSFNWESEKPTVPKNSEVKLKQTEIENKVRAQKSKSNAKKQAMRGEEDVYKRDTSIEVSDDPSFDDDAIIEDNSGLEEEFSLE
ncbi:MAG: monofunctional biosynthetic peptidoglycan transglycosylase [Halobacteriovorax sp.]|nr:monofunctional biosynthetic peptidoglycan transglycosylase [Halobacteriovorax sp.]|tara:strand:- start:50839 stop:51822 length:984 start_codon:yes stop_codon:yes gene_type:complete